MKKSGFSQPPVPCSLATFLESTARTKLDGVLLGVLFRWSFTTHSKKPPIKCRDTDAQAEDGNTNKKSAEIVTTHFGTSKVVSWRAGIFSEMRPLRRTDSPRAKQRVHYRFLESPLAGFGEYTCCLERLSKKIADACLASLTRLFRCVLRSPSLSSWEGLVLSSKYR